MTQVRRWLLTGGLLAALLAMTSVPVRATEDSKLININSASAAELATMKGIGDAKAKAIVEHREKNGPFKSVDDLKNVKGIGDKMLAALRPQMTTGEAAPAPAQPAPAAGSAAKH